MDFTKMQGAANDFVLVEADNDKREWSKLAIAMCERHLGIGADSLLLLLPSNKEDFYMRIFNADGSEAEACGNGIRYVARYVFEKGKINPGTNEISIETIADIRTIKLEKKTDGTDINLNLVSMGNPHAIYFSLNPVSEFPLSMIGFKVERLPIFPKRINFEVARMLSRQHLEARVWERGVGEILDCGSGGYAIAVASKMHGFN